MLMPRSFAEAEKVAAMGAVAPFAAAPRGQCGT